MPSFLRVSVKACTSCSLVKIRKRSPPWHLSNASLLQFHSNLPTCKKLIDPVRRFISFVSSGICSALFLCVNSTVSVVIDVWGLIEREGERKGLGRTWKSDVGWSAFCSHTRFWTHNCRTLRREQNECLWWGSDVLMKGVSERVSDKCQVQRLNAKEYYSIRPASHLIFQLNWQGCHSYGKSGNIR